MARVGKKVADPWPNRSIGHRRVGNRTRRRSSRINSYNIIGITHAIDKDDKPSQYKHRFIVSLVCAVHTAAVNLPPPPMTTLLREHSAPRTRRHSSVVTR